MQIAERYAVAGSGSDVLIAAAWSGEDAGATLSRCRNEFDEAHAATPTGAGAAARRTLTLTRVASLSPALRVVAAFATWRAGPDAQEFVDRVSWQALGVWLDPTCSSCGGVGFRGGYNGAPRLRCGHCKETGKRRGSVGNSPVQREFIDWLVCRIESAVSEFENTTARRLRN